jgi:hypothetical protein
MEEGMIRVNSLGRALLAISLLGFFGPMVAQADAVLDSSSVIRSSDQRCQQTGGASSACDFNETQIVIPGEAFRNIAATASGQADFGILHAASKAVASCQVEVGGVNCYGFAVEAVGQASFSDLITIANAPASGFLDFKLVADGTDLETCVGTYATVICGAGGASTGFSAAGNALISLNGSSFVREAGANLPDGTSIVHVRMPFTQSQDGTASVGISFGLTADVACWVAISTNCSAHADFADTAIVSGVSVLDDNGQQVNGASVSSVSGTDYNNILQPTTAPEPSTLVLFCGGLIGVGWALTKDLRVAQAKGTGL